MAITPLTIKTPNDEEAEFILAMQKFKEDNNKKFPTWSEAFRVLKSLGYIKAPLASELVVEKPKKPRKPRAKRDA